MNLSKEVKKLIIGMLQTEDSRYSMRDIIESDWYRGETAKEEDVIKEMTKRKIKVDEERKKAFEKKVNPIETEEKLYRGGIDESDHITMLDILKMLEDSNVDEFPKKVKDKPLTKYFLIFKSSDIVEAYISFFKLLFHWCNPNKGLKLNLDRKKFLCEVDVPFLFKEDLMGLEQVTIKNQNYYECAFSINAKFYLEAKEQNVIVEIINISNNNEFEMREFIKYMQN